MQEAQANLNKYWKETGQELHIGIGIAAGPVNVGIFGSRKRTTYKGS